MRTASSHSSAGSGALRDVGPGRVADTLAEFHALPIHVQARAWRELRAAVEYEREREAATA